MSRRRKSGGGAACECQGDCNRAHTGPCPNVEGLLAADSRYPVRLEIVAGRVLCTGCREPFNPDKRWRW